MAKSHACILLLCSISLIPFANVFLLARAAVEAKAANQPGDEPIAIRELAERLLTPQQFGGISPIGSGAPVALEEPSAELLVGRIAPELGLEVTLPAGSRLIGSVVRRGGISFAGIA